ncbi:hypothetical protein N8517_00260 [Synechococcus sp. AH-601-L23]|nr:hypothetical protein [Synechococcus sp. AH-601-L23]
MKDIKMFSSSLFLRGLKAESDSTAVDPNQKTFIVFGVPRGGTTMIARVAEKLGVCMGSDLPSNYEDSEFNFDKLSDAIKKDQECLASTLFAAINRRNAMHDVWGWKYPRAHRYLSLIINQVRNPHLICVMRDPVASSLRPLARKRMPKEEKRYSPARIINQHLMYQQKNITLIDEFKRPTFLCSYEKAILDPPGFVADLSSFIDLRKDERSLEEAVQQIQPGGYIEA